jgi:hypothetical protein
MSRLVVPVSLIFLTAVLTSVEALEYRTQVIASGLEQPAGIAVNARGDLFFTQLPTPGVPGVMGGRNKVSMRHFLTGAISNITVGEPEPTNIAIGVRGALYWTCRSANVILTHQNGMTSLFLGGLNKPVGIAADVNGPDRGTIYYTEVPTPGTPGGMNGVFSFGAGGIDIISMGEPYPADVAVDQNGILYWTCKTAGVILKHEAGTTSLLLDGLNSPMGITVDKDSNLYFTEVPTPGVSGGMGGQNKVWKYDLTTATRSLVDAGDPYPNDITAHPNGTLYWTCRSAGVIVQAKPIRD